MIGILLSAILVSSTSGGSEVDDSRPLAGVLLVSSDEAVVKRLSSEFKPGMPTANLRKAFSASRFVVEDWGTRSAVVLDKASGPPKRLADLCAMSETLAKSVGEDLTVKLGDLPGNERGPIMDRIGGPNTQPSGFDVNSASIGLFADLNFNVVGPDGRTFSCSVPYKTQSTVRRDQSLRSHPALKRPLDSGERKHLAYTIAGQASARDDELRLRPYGNAVPLLPEGMQVATRLVDSLYKDLAARRAAASQVLLAKFALDGAHIPPGPVGLNDLPADLRQDVQRCFGDSWQSYGFSSQMEADSFLQNSAGLRVETEVGFSFCENPGNPAAHIPEMGGIVIFSTLPGGISP